MARLLMQQSQVTTFSWPKVFFIILEGLLIGRGGYRVENEDLRGALQNSLEEIPNNLIL